MVYKRMPAKRSQEDIAALAKEIVTGNLYTSDDPRVATMLTLVFMPLGFGALAGYTGEQCQRLVVFAIAGQDASVPGRSINGYPMFLSCRIWRRADYAAAVAMAGRMQAAMAAVAQG